MTMARAVLGERGKEKVARQPLRSQRILTNRAQQPSSPKSSWGGLEGGEKKNRNSVQQKINRGKKAGCCVINGGSRGPSVHFPLGKKPAEHQGGLSKCKSGPHHRCKKDATMAVREAKN